MSGSVANINNFIQLQLRVNKQKEVDLITAADWLDKYNYLKDSQSSPGFPLVDKPESVPCSCWATCF